MALNEWGVRSSAVVGSRVIGWIAGGAVAVMLVRLLWLSRRGTGDIRWGVYLGIVGLVTLASYSVTCTLSVGAHPVLRYINLGLLLPIGVFGAFMAVEPSRVLRAAAVAAFVVWGTANFADNVKTIHAAIVNPEPDPHGELTQFLLSNQIRYARAGYWDAYVVDFLSNERIIVGSWVPSRIPEYERRVNSNRDTAVHIERVPCEGWATVARWCIQLPARQQ